jgi:hypothetical protein
MDPDVSTTKDSATGSRLDGAAGGWITSPSTARPFPVLST